MINAVMHKESQTALEEAIVRTVAWFSLFSYPVTAEDIWKWLVSEKEDFRLEDVRACLCVSKRLASILQTQDGWYALACHKSLAEMQQGRHERILDAARKFKKLRRVVRWFGLLPTVRSVAAVNTLSWWHTKPASDIDLFIAVRPGTLWITRLLLVIPFALMGKRPDKNPIGKLPVDPFCFSFFVTTDVQEIENLQIDGGDPYLAFWVRAIVPLIDRDGWLAAFQKKNSWVKRMLPNTPEVQVHEKMSAKPLRSIPAPWARFDAWAEQIQQKRFPDKIKELANKDTRVIISGQMLKFYVNDRRAEYRDRWLSLIDQLV
jgi:hypothetical protein